MTRILTEKLSQDHKGRYYFEVDSDPQNAMTLFANKSGGLTIAVSEEKAMDSYNEAFECSISLDANEAKKLRNYLLKYFPL